jgi:L,D-transpeptidase catalytic domain
MFTMLIVSVDATSSVLQQPVNILAKETLPDNATSFNAPQHTQYTYTKNTESNFDRDTSYNLIDTRNKATVDRLKQQAASLKDYAKANNYSTEYCFLVDMSIPSGKKRFFVYNMRKDSLEFSSLVAHGFGSYKQDCDDKLVFSNMPYSFKTSLGKYKIGSSYKGTYGLSYKLFGLDSTNSRAFERAIVLHSDLHVPETETFPRRIFQSAGCPTVTPSFLPILGSYIKSSKKPILMWIYN